MLKERLKKTFYLFILLLLVSFGVAYLLLQQHDLLSSFFSPDLSLIFSEMTRSDLFMVSVLVLYMVLLLLLSWAFAGTILYKSLLQENKRFFDEYLDMTSDWFWETDKDMKLIDISWNLKKLTGLEPGNYMGRHLSNLMKPKIGQKINPIAAMEEKQAYENLSFEILSNKGKSIEFSISAWPYFYRNKFMGYRGTARDNTNYKNLSEKLQFKVNAAKIAEIKAEEYAHELKRSVQELKKAKIESERVARTKGSFLANMSHEIRTPLNAINGFISLLVEEERDERKLRYLDTVRSASHSLLHTINDILDFTKIENGKLSIDKVDFYAHKEISSLVELFQVRAVEKYIDLKMSYDALVPEIIHGDILRIKQVISNLLSNAIKFTPEHGEVLLSIQYLDSQLMITVSDNGIGIPEDKLEYIFDSFAQADGSTVREYGGSGLGLSISSQLVEMMGGTLSVKSQEGSGSKFFFSIPVEKGYHVKSEEDTISQIDYTLTGDILIVEDVVANQMFIQLLLQREGLNYDVANDGVEAVEKFEQNKYDLILMDENMPRLNGRGATGRIRAIEQEKNLPPIPIIALTANALVGDREKFLKAGMDDYISKPVDPVKLKIMLALYLHT